MKYFKSQGAIFKVLVFIALIVLLSVAINSDMYGKISPTGWGLICTIAGAISFNSNLRVVFNTQDNLNKALILISIFWILLSPIFLMSFLDYDNDDFFGRYSMDGISAILFLPLCLVIGRWLYAIYINSVKNESK